MTTHFDPTGPFLPTLDDAVRAQYRRLHEQESEMIDLAEALRVASQADPSEDIDELSMRSRLYGDDASLRAFLAALQIPQPPAVEGRWTLAEWMGVRQLIGARRDALVQRHRESTTKLRELLVQQQQMRAGRAA